MERGLHGGGQEFDGEIAVGYRVEAVCHRYVKAQRFCGRGAVDWKRRASERRCAKRRLVQPRSAVGIPAAVALCHLVIGHQMMAQSHRLRDLQMGDTRDDTIGMFRCALNKCRLKCRKSDIDTVDGAAHPKPEIGCNLIVPRPRCM